MSTCLSSLRTSIFGFAVAILLITLPLPSTVHCALAWTKVDHTPLCFTEETVVENEKVIIDYQQRYPAHVSGAVSHVETSASITYRAENTNIASFHLKHAGGHFSFQALKQGAYDICFSRTSTGDENELAIEVHAQFKYGRMDEPESHVFSRQKVPTTSANSVDSTADVMEVMSFLDVDGQIKETLRSREYLKRVNDHISSIRREMNLIQEVAVEFMKKHIEVRNITESTFERTWGMSAVTLLVIVLLALFQYRHMKEFLIKKKLV